MILKTKKYENVATKLVKIASIQHTRSAADTGWRTHSTAVQRQQVVSAYFTSKQILPFGRAEYHILVAYTCSIPKFYITNLSHML